MANHTEFLEDIARWQRDAVKITLPAGTGCLSAVGGLTGPAFFPEGFGLSYAALRGKGSLRVLAIGHNFGCEVYRKGIEPAGREDNQATWRNLDKLLSEAGSHPDDCFRTNWFIGLQPGEKQIGSFLNDPNPPYERACCSLLAVQIRRIKPKAILLLGPEVASRAHQLIPSLLPWKDAKKWIEIDRSSIGHSVLDVEIPAASLRANVVALLHPSFAAVNQGRRMKNMTSPVTESQIVRAALA